MLLCVSQLITHSPAAWPDSNNSGKGGLYNLNNLNLGYEVLMTSAARFIRRNDEPEKFMEATCSVRPPTR